MDFKKIVTKVRLQFVMNLIAASIVASLNSAKAYADGLKDALVAGDIAFTHASFNGGQKTDVGAALVELAEKGNSDAVTFEVLQSPNTGKLKTYRFTKGTGATAQTMDIDIEKDLLNGTFSLVTITEDGGKYYDGATEVTAAQGVTGAGVYMKYNSNAAGETETFSYADMSKCIEYLTVGNQTGKVVTLAIDPQTHTITADIADKAQLPQTGMPSTDMSSAVQTSLGKADSALQSADFDEITEAECTSAWEAAMAAANTPANAGE